MSVTVIVGGQYGNEGKGKVAKWFGMNYGCDYAVMNAEFGSTSSFVKSDGEEQTCIFISAAQNPTNTTKYVFPSGCIVDLSKVKAEMGDRGLTDDQIIIDSYALAIDMMMGPNHNPIIGLAKDIPEFKKYIQDVKSVLCEAIELDKKIIIEGTRGFGLSIHNEGKGQGINEPTAAGVISRVGLSPSDVTNIIMVIKPYPTLLGTFRDYLPNEISWEEITERGNGDELFQEGVFTGEEILPHRVMEFDKDLVRNAIMVNNPSLIVLNHADVLDIPNQGCGELTENQVEDITEIEEMIGVKIDLVGNGPDTMIRYEKMLEESTLKMLGFEPGDKEAAAALNDTLDQIGNAPSEKVPDLIDQMLGE